MSVEGIIGGILNPFKSVSDQIRGLLLERGITLRKGRCHLEARLPGILEDATTKLSGASTLAAGATQNGTGPIGYTPRGSGYAG